MPEFSDALEQQVACARWLDSREGMDFLRAMAYQNELNDIAHVPRSDYVGITHISICAAIPIYWSPDMCRLLDAASTAMPDCLLAEDSIPADNGFMWLAESIALPDPDLGRLVAIQYAKLRTQKAPPGEQCRALMISSDAAFPSDADGFALHLVFWLAHRGRFSAICHNPWMPGVQIEWFGGDALSTLRDRAEQSVRCAEIAAAAFALLGQRLVLADESTGERATKWATRGRAERFLGSERHIRIVRFRRAESVESAGNGAPVEWACRWMVRGHWRRQYCGPDQARRPIWIAPHVKGPPDKPLRAPAQPIFAVVR